MKFNGDSKSRIERALGRALTRATPELMPSRLAGALRDALFPGGARLRPHLCLIAAVANGDPRPSLTDRACAAVELIHSASLVHDDLPCFDDAALRRGRPSVQHAWGEAAAVLVGDQLIVQAFAEVARAPRMVATLAQATRGLVAGQALEMEDDVDVARYHRAKTGSLFSAAAALGAISAGVDPAPWRVFGLAVGQAYQAADDLADVTGEAAMLGKPVGQDELRGRPNLVTGTGLDGSKRHLRSLLAEASLRAPADAARAFVANLTERVAV